jgi:hypothetical protein
MTDYQNIKIYKTRLDPSLGIKPDPQLQKEFASRCAAGLVKALEALPERELGEYLASLKPDEGKAFALALGGECSWRNIASLPELAKLHEKTAVLINRVLAALNHAPSTATTTAIVKNLCLQIVPTDFTSSRGDRQPPLSPHNVAFAIAYVWYPNNHAQAKLAMAHVEDLLSSRKGVELMFGGTSLEKMQRIFEVVRRYPGITAQTFANYDGDPMRHPAVTTALARQFLGVGPTDALTNEQFDAVERLSANFQTKAGQALISSPAPEKAKLEAIVAIIGDPKIKFDPDNDNPFANEQLQKDIAPLYARAGQEGEYIGESLRNLAGLALGLTPKFPANWDISADDVIALRQALKDGTDLNHLPPKLASLLACEPLFEKNETLDQIVKTLNDRANSKPPRVAIDFNVVFTQLGPVRCPAFRVHVADFDPEPSGEGKYEYVDNVGRLYKRENDRSSLENYLADNTLPPGMLYGAAFGHRATPETNKPVEHTLDAAAYYGCFAAGVVGLVFSGGALALAAGAVGTAGIGWKTYRGIQNVVDRSHHGQNIDPFVAGEAGVDAFMMWAGLVTDPINLLAFGVTTGLTGSQALGLISPKAKWVLPAIRTINATVAVPNATHVALSGKQLHDRWQRLTQKQRNELFGDLLLQVLQTAKQGQHMATPGTAEITRTPPGTETEKTPPSPIELQPKISHDSLPNNPASNDNHWLPNKPVSNDNDVGQPMKMAAGAPPPPPGKPPGGGGKKGGRGKGSGAPPAGTPPSGGGKRGKGPVPPKKPLSELSEGELGQRSVELFIKRKSQGLSAEEEAEFKAINEIIAKKAAEEDAKNVGTEHSITNPTELVENLDHYIEEYNDLIVQLHDERNQFPESKRENIDRAIDTLTRVVEIAKRVQWRLRAPNVTTEDLSNAANFAEDMADLQYKITIEGSADNFLEVLSDYRNQIIDLAMDLDGADGFFASKLLRQYALLTNWTDANGWCGTVSPNDIIAAFIKEVYKGLPDHLSEAQQRALDEVISGLKTLQLLVRPPSGEAN